MTAVRKRGHEVSLKKRLLSKGGDPGNLGRLIDYFVLTFASHRSRCCVVTEDWEFFFGRENFRRLRF